MSKYKYILFFVIVIQAIICYPRFSKKYDPDNNDNFKVFVFLIFGVLLFLALTYPTKPKIPSGNLPSALPEVPANSELP